MVNEALGLGVLLSISPESRGALESGKSSVASHFIPDQEISAQTQKRLVKRLTLNYHETLLTSTLCLEFRCPRQKNRCMFYGTSRGLRPGL